MIKLPTALLGLALTAIAASVGAGRATAGTCEQDVVAECVKTTCPAFCKGGDGAAACKKTCTADDRCKLTLFGGQDRADQAELDIQTRAQLIACLAENRAKIEVPDDLGKPVLVEDKGDGATTKPAKAGKRGSVKDRKVSKKGWKKLQTRAFVARKKGKKRVDPVVE